MMIRYLVAAAAATLLLAACTPPSNNDVVAAKAATTAAPASRALVKTKFLKSDSTEIPSEIVIPSSVGEVIFRHQMHVKDLSIKCVECHHQIYAKELSTPHPDYLKSSWVNCKVCHDGSGKIKQTVYTCSDCHHSNPIDIADETLSSKVVIHKQCWKCHPVSTGAEASTSCGKCHAGKKTL
jgi:hypothetical protein